MNFNSALAVMAVGVTACFMLNGCARGHSKEAVYQPIQPVQPVPSDQFTVRADGTAPLSYQWYFNNNTNGESQQIHVEAGTNAQLLYQWYKNTNTNEGAQH